jgi:hypothetical protein
MFGAGTIKSEYVHIKFVVVSAAYEYQMLMNCRAMLSQPPPPKRPLRLSHDMRNAM